MKNEQLSRGIELQKQYSHLKEKLELLKGSDRKEVHFKMSNGNTFSINPAATDLKEKNSEGKETRGNEALFAANSICRTILISTLEQELERLDAEFEKL
jgi:hypothetical protein